LIVLVVAIEIAVVVAVSGPEAAHGVVVKMRAVADADVVAADPADMGIAADRTGMHRTAKPSDACASTNTADMNASDRPTHMDAAEATNVRAATKATTDVSAATKSAHVAAAESSTMAAAPAAACVGRNGQHA
jgi:hypothetical protein